jgi:hypothetical protein
MDRMTRAIGVISKERIGIKFDPLKARADMMSDFYRFSVERAPDSLC